MVGLSRSRRSPSGGRVLAAAGGVVADRDALHLPGEHATPARVPWERVDAAEWDADAGTLTVTEVAPDVAAAPRHVVVVDEADPRARDRLLQVVRERVTASVVLQRHVRVVGRAGLHVVARRPPGGGALAWGFRFDVGIDPNDPAVRRVAADALARARDDVGA
ncbi:hypothetical protein QE364_001509 [Nocardioides zeae]|uniref:Uncharacterized protein n=2 Tax=Nocardioides zeae TaxID=1457234 RepID=A0ACC6IGL4_9ACTN|nr:hypothetical protein [Nocardioides zeae]MDQ1103481.1 hypothetical protein [Nocardioides zeae]MDR6172799.1 hypothetical protein [Nocardioides zeae]MDR6209809.1 hypothetical protein [Nocardioides zeae]